MLDFFSPPDEQCTRTSARLAYLYDGLGAAPAVLSPVALKGRPVLVANPAEAPYVFRPVDKVLYGPGDSKRGDVFLHTVDRLRLIFAELKLWHVSGWFNEGVAQLKAVVLDFIAAHPDVASAATVRRAYVCNPYHPRFAFSYAAEIRDFHRATSFVLYPEAVIAISTPLAK